MSGFWFTELKVNNFDIQSIVKCYEDHSGLLLMLFCVSSFEILIEVIKSP